LRRGRIRVWTRQIATFLELGAMSQLKRTPTKFRLRDVTRALRGVEAAGFKPKRFEIDADGKIIIALDNDSNVEAATPFDAWKNARSA